MSDPTHLGSVCDQTCFEDAKWKSANKPCSPGKPLCDDNKVIACEGQVLPTEEICDGQDNDCNGLRDDGIASMGNCLSPEGCKGLLYCINASFQCVGGASSLGQQCYDGDPQDLFHPPCHGGVVGCSGLCEFQQLPTPEICDNQDNDCDGAIDEGLAANASIDIVHLLDTSGSMWFVDKMGIAVKVMDQLALLLGGAIYKHSLVSITAESATVSISLTSGVKFRERLNPQSDWYIKEPSYDALWDLQAGIIDPGFRKYTDCTIIMWTDEPGQSYRDPKITEFELMGLDKCQVITVTEALFKRYWDDLGPVFEFDGDLALTIRPYLQRCN